MNYHINEVSNQQYSTTYAQSRLTTEFSRPEKRGTSNLWEKCNRGMDRVAFQDRLQRDVRRDI